MTKKTEDETRRSLNSTTRRLAISQQCHTPVMNLKTAAFFAFIGMALWTIVLAVDFIRNLSALAAGAVAAVTVLTWLIRLLASLSVAVFFFVFHKAQS